MRRAVLLATLITLTASRAANAQTAAVWPGGQQTRAGTALIVGQVVDARTGRGIAGAVVSLAGGPGRPRSIDPGASAAQRVMATSDGLYVFRDLAPGSYAVTARKPGYLEGAFGRRNPSGAMRTIRLAEAERLDNVNIPIWKYASISGTVVDEAGEPVVGIEVRAMRRTVLAGTRRFGTPASATTDDRGMYRIAMLAPGDYVVAVVSTQVAVPAALIEEARRAVESSDTSSSAMRVFEVGASTSPPGSPTAVQVGDHVRTIGRSQVPPPPPAEGVLFVYPTVFFPSSGSSSDAGLVSIDSGEERAGADFQLNPVPATSVSGKVVGQEGSVQGVAVRLVLAESEGFATDLESAATVSAGDGSFTFLAVPPGSYVLHVTQTPRPPGPAGTPTVIQSGSGMTIMTMASGTPGDPQVSPEPTWWARVPLEVGARPLPDVTVTLRAGGRIGGRVVFDGAGPRPTPDQLTAIAVVVETADGRSSMRMPPTRIDRFGRFTTPGLPGGRYLVRAGSAPAGWTFKGAMLDGRDASDVALELDSVDLTNIALTFTDRPTELAGMVRSDQGSPDADATVLVFPADPETWTGYGSSGRRFRSARADSTGAYSLTGLPPGSYCAIAIPDDLTADWQDPAILEKLARRSTPVQIENGQSRTQDLRTER